LGPRAGWTQRVEEKSSAFGGDRTPFTQIIAIITLKKVICNYG
jgi:hypothetical protein